MTESDVIVRKCVVSDENDIDVVNHIDNVTRSHDTLLGNVEIVKDDNNNNNDRLTAFDPGQPG